MRWPAARFVSALEQFNVPQRMRVPCKRERRHSGGACHGSTCERDFAFTWSCLNATVERTGMLATFVRCVLDKSTLKEVTRKQLADLDAISATPRGAQGGAEGGATSALEQYLHVSPYISLHLPISPHISLPISPRRDQRARAAACCARGAG